MLESTNNLQIVVNELSLLRASAVLTILTGQHEPVCRKKRFPDYVAEIIVTSVHLPH